MHASHQRTLGESSPFPRLGTSLNYSLNDHEFLISQPPYSQVLNTIIFHAAATMMAFLFTFNDMFLILVSVAVSSRLQNFNGHLRASLNKVNENQVQSDKSGEGCHLKLCFSFFCNIAYET